MRNLLRTDFRRLLKSRSFLLALVGVTSLVYLCMFFSSGTDGEASGVSLCNTLCSLSVLMTPLFVSGAYMLFVSAEFTGGAIRNKLIVGHRRANVFLSWNLVGLANGLIVSAASLGSAALLIGLFGDTTGLVAKNVIAASVIIVCMLISKLCMSVLISVIIPGAKGMLFNYLLTYALLMFFVIMYDSAPDSKIVNALSRCFPEGQVTSLNVSTMPDRPWLTVVCALAFSVLCVVLGVYVFKRKDLS